MVISGARQDEDQQASITSLVDYQDVLEESHKPHHHTYCYRADIRR